MFSQPPPGLAGKLYLPTDVNNWLGVTNLREKSLDGAGTQSVIIDSGCFSHPFFVANALSPPNVVLGVGTDGITEDQYGHGTDVRKSTIDCA